MECFKYIYKILEFIKNNKLLSLIIIIFLSCFITIIVNHRYQSAPIIEKELIIDKNIANNRKDNIKRKIIKKDTIISSEKGHITNQSTNGDQSPAVNNSMGGTVNINYGSDTTKKERQ